MRVNVQSAIAFLDEPLDDVEAEAGSLLGPFGGKVGLKYFRQHFRWDARAVVAHPKFDQRRGVVRTFNVEQPIIRAVFEYFEIERCPEQFTADFDAMFEGHALKGVHRQVEQNLDKVGAVDFDTDVLGQRRNAKFVFMRTGMHTHELIQVLEQLIDTDARDVFARLAAKKTEVAPGNFDAVARLPRDDAQAVLDEVQVLHLQP